MNRSDHSATANAAGQNPVDDRSERRPAGLRERIVRVLQLLPQRSALLASTVFILGLLLTVLIARWHEENNTQLTQSAFLRQSDRLAQVLLLRIRSYERGLRGLRGVFVIDPGLSREKFDAYVASRDMPNEFPGVTGMGFVRRVAAPDVESFVTARHAADPGFTFRREQTNPGAAMIVDYFAPASRGRHLIGLDMGSHPELREAAMRAMWKNDMALSMPVTHENDSEMAFVLPVYRPGAPIDTPQQRSEAVTGWVLMVIDASTLFSGLHDDQIAIDIFDLVVDETPRQIFASSPAATTDARWPELDPASASQPLQRRIEMVFGQRNWLLLISPLPTFWQPLALLPPSVTYIIGSSCSLLAALLVHFLLATRRRALELAERMTAELRFNEVRQHDFSLSASDWFWETDAQHRFSYFSENFENLFCLDLKTVIGMTRQQLLHRHGVLEPERLAEHLKCLDAHQPFRHFEYGFLVKGDEMRWFSVSGVPHFDTAGRFAGYRGCGEDITARKSAETAVLLARDEAERARREAEAASQAKSRFLSRMSHELRTPLNAILGFAQLLDLDRSSLSETHADNVKEILLAGEHLLGMVNEVLDLSRIESGRLDLRLETVHLEPLIAACWAQLRPLAVERTLTFDAPSVPETMVEADATRLKQILLNLLSNAIKYNRPGGRIRVTILPAGERIRIEINDTGRGIADNQLPRLFKPFERIDDGHSVEGTGIGLALVRKLVEHMGGEVGVQSEPGRGSTFWFTLYRADTHPGAETTPAADHKGRAA